MEQNKKQETLEEAAKNYASKKLQRLITIYNPLDSNVAEYVGFVNGAKWQEQRMYSEKEVIDLMTKAFESGFKKADVVEAGLEGKETDVEVKWILNKKK